MTSAPKPHPARRRFAVVLLGLAALGMAALPLLLPTSAQAQRYRDDGYQGQGFNPFGFLFGGPRYQRAPEERYRRAPQERYHRAPEERERAAPVDYSKAPPPAKRDTEPTRRIVVLGAGMAGWLAYGLEEALADEPEFGVVRKEHLHSGLIHYDSRSDSGWQQALPDVLKDVSADVLVMLVGLNDRQAIQDLIAPAADAAKDERNGDAKQDDATKDDAKKKPPPQVKRGPSYEFHTDKWAQAYQKRIDATIAALKKKGVPVIWVGMPPIRGTRSTSDMIYLNDLFRARAEHANIPYVDVWDGFTDDAGHYTNFGPDVEGQRRRLRTPDGVYFTKAGARKLAHYVERELKRVINTKPLPVALPGPGVAGQPAAVMPGAPAPRPLAGPVLPLNRIESSGNLAGASGVHGTADPLAVRVLVNGEAVPAEAGRADNFSWKGAGAKPAAAGPSSQPGAPAATPAAKAPAATTPTPTPAKPELEGAAAPAKDAAAKASAKAPSVNKPAGETLAGGPPADAAKPAEKSAPAAANNAAAPAAIAKPEPAPAEKPETRAMRAKETPEEPKEKEPKAQPHTTSRRAAEDRPRPPASVGTREAQRQQRRPARSQSPPAFDPFGFLRGDGR